MQFVPKHLLEILQIKFWRIAFTSLVSGNQNISEDSKELCWTDGSAKNCKVTGGDQGTSKTCDQVSLTLVNDATQGPGPETLYLENVGSCSNDFEDCKLVYAVTSQGDKMNEADWFVTVYNNDGKVLEVAQPEAITADTWYYVVFTLHLKTGMICPGFKSFRTNTISC